MYTLAELAQAIGAEVAGDHQAIVKRAQAFDHAGPGDITFAADPALLNRVAASGATAIIVSTAVGGAKCSLLLASNPKLAFARAVRLLHHPEYRSAGISADLLTGEGTALGNQLSIHPRVTIGKNCRIGDRVTLHPGVVVGDSCTIGEDSVIHPNVTLYEQTQIGCRVVIHAGTVIGADGFGFVADEQGKQVKLLQLGCVIIEDDCEIGANCAIDRGGFEDTILRRGVKLDNLIQVGHNCTLGEDSVVAAQTGFSGGTNVGRRCTIAGQVGTQQHIRIGDGAIIMGQTGVTKDVRPGAVMGGTVPAQDYRKWRRRHAVYSRLPELSDRVRRLETIIKDTDLRGTAGASDKDPSTGAG
jgi:UDP-3-O-[3-hydroxymyristoyl] glucosamine N-acyltransferase